MHTDILSRVAYKPTVEKLFSFALVCREWNIVAQQDERKKIVIMLKRNQRLDAYVIPFCKGTAFLLMSLDFDETDIDDEDIIAFVNAAMIRDGNLLILLYLHLCYNNIGDAGITAIADALHTNRKLQVAARWIGVASCQCRPAVNARQLSVPAGDPEGAGRDVDCTDATYS